LIGSVKRKDVTIQKLDDKNNEIEIKKSQIEEIQKNIDSSQYNEERYNEIKVLESRINEDISTNSAILGQVNGKLSQINERIEYLNKALETNLKIKEEHDTLEKHIALLKEIRGLYSKDGIQGILRARSKPVIEMYTKKFFEEFNFNYSNLILDNEYNITLYGPEGEAKLDMISGGEKIAVALALRLGITQAMSKGSIETILLDEPTIHLDSQRRQELIGLLRGMSVLPQMIIVTHDSELENAADSIIKVKKENGISKVEIE
jgi:exonuclease SbcC